MLRQVLKAHGLEPLLLGPKEVRHSSYLFFHFPFTSTNIFKVSADTMFCSSIIQGLALINGTQLITSLGAEGKLVIFFSFHS